MKAHVRHLLITFVIALLLLCVALVAARSAAGEEKQPGSNSRFYETREGKVDERTFLGWRAYEIRGSPAS